MDNMEKALKKVKCAKLDGPIYNCLPIPGPTGPAGPTTVNVGNTYTINSNENAKVQNSGTNDNVILDFYIPKGSDGNGEKGDIGPTGPEGPYLIEMAYVTKFIDNFTDDGIEVKIMEDIPISRKEIDNKNIVTLNNNKIKFNKAGHYKISFKVNAYVKKDNVFDPSKDFVAIGFKPNDSDNIYVGASNFISDEMPKEISGDGIVAVVDPSILYSLVNLGKKSIYLKTPDLNNINSDSYFVNSPVSILFEYIGI